MSGDQTGRSEITAPVHAVAEPQAVRKMNVYGMYRGTCVCGWQSKGWGSTQRALKDAEQHVAAKLSTS